MKKNIERRQENVPGKKNGNDKSKHTSALAAAAKGRSATAAVKHDSNTDVRGSSGLANTGPFVSYNDGE